MNTQDAAGDGSVELSPAKTANRISNDVSGGDNTMQYTNDLVSVQIEELEDREAPGMPWGVCINSNSQIPDGKTPFVAVVR
jgi:hypothetical protein